jgi:Sec-independent protein translocase protein TatA
MIFRVLLWVLLAYFIYRFVFDFLVPLLTATRRFKKQVREFQNRAQQQQDPLQQQSSADRQSTKPPEKAGDYIDFEELKSK